MRCLSLHFSDLINNPYSGFDWREPIPLRSTNDLSTHNYTPKSDVAIIQILPTAGDDEARILFVFEAYSKSGQSDRTPDENRTDRVRLLLQGSYISRKEVRPSVVFYLTREKYMETILVFSSREEKVCCDEYHTEYSILELTVESLSRKSFATTQRNSRSTLKRHG